MENGKDYNDEGIFNYKGAYEMRLTRLEYNNLMLKFVSINKIFMTVGDFARYVNNGYEDYSKVEKLQNIDLDEFQNEFSWSRIFELNQKNIR